MILAVSKRAYFDYAILETYEAGIELLGLEVKAIKSGRVNISSAHVIIRGGEPWLINADIPPYQPNNTPQTYDSKRTRKLLLKKSEIANLIGRVAERGLTIVPLKVYTKARRIKIEIGLGKSKRAKDKREVLKKRAVIREMRREI